MTLYTPLNWAAGVTPLSEANMDHLETQYDAAKEGELHLPFTAGINVVPIYPEVHAQLTGFELDAAAEYCSLSFEIPKDFGTLVAAYIPLVGRTNGDFDWTVNTTWGAVGESFTADTDSVTENAKAVVDNIVNEVDVTLAFTGIVARDKVYVKFLLDALNVTTSVHVGYVAFI